MKALITGINSALGESIAARLSSDRKNRIIGLDIKPNRRFQTLEHDLASEKEIKDVPFDVCIHLAFITDPKYCEENRGKAYRVNVLGTRKMLEHCKRNGAKKFILISTGGVYGFSDKPLMEKSRLRPHDAYSRMKAEAEKLSKEYTKFFDVAVLRYFFPYGPGAKENSLINRLIASIKEKKPIRLNNSGSPVINPIYITELAEATCLLCSKKTGSFAVFNVAGPEQASIRKLAAMLSGIMKTEPIFEDAGKSSKDMVADITKLKRFYRPKIRLKEGLKRTVESNK